MKGYAVYKADKDFTDPLNHVDNLVFIKEGVAWFAVFSPLLWALFHRLWFVALIVFCVMVSLNGLLTGLGISEPQKFILLLSANILFALEANRIKTWSVKRSGYMYEGFVTGANLPDCQRRFFNNWPVISKTAEQ